ncbi:putative plasma membrane antiporter [Paecilomyces variotii]|uniref:Putative plasma membrane antiporter n=1 Tax=Byssochlamys spectabilis TaxID=264951 RepID=A0A443I724_BYSSP|nr:putative plasma membrane antiporter [Paecilomyces variotii]KAJ9233610.1 hypothetical protein DTO169E5_6986 [Paecilomyces variotii]KAJ9356111.1 hypothetical protein DTO280E4_6216 [Paecilomyces variotii]RWQ99848.1 putative plasma membrane antiporter [Paecilomyces variotii]
MLRPILDVSNLNVVLSVAGAFSLIFGFLSLKLKQKWYIGEALPAFVLGILLGPVGAKFLIADQWGNGEAGQSSEITLGVARVVIGIQMVKAGYELPKQYLRERFVEMTIYLLAVMTLMWLFTSACIMLFIPKISFLSSLIIASCVTPTDPILSQAIAKGPFADNYVHRHVREFISSEAGGNDGFGFPFLLLAVSLLRYAEAPANTISLEDFDLARGIPDALGSSDVGRFGGGTGEALKHWAVEGVIYMVMMGFSYGALVGYGSRKILNLSLRKKWICNECYLIFPVGMALFIIGTCGCVGSDETLACFIAGNALNWDGQYLHETEARHDSFNPAIETLLNFGAFMYLGTVMPWDTFQMPEATGITVARLFGLGLFVLVFRRIPAILMTYRFMSKVCNNWREAMFLGYFGPIGLGAISYAEYTSGLFPEPGESDREINNLTSAIVPVVYWLVFFSIIVHGLSVPILSFIYRVLHVKPISDIPVEIVILSENEPLPNNSELKPEQHSAIVHNRFSRMETGAMEYRNQRHTLHPDDANGIRGDEGWPLPEQESFRRDSDSDSDSMRKHDVVETEIKNIV